MLRRLVLADSRATHALACSRGRRARKGRLRAGINGLLSLALATPGFGLGVGVGIIIYRRTLGVPLGRTAAGGKTWERRGRTESPHCAHNGLQRARLVVRVPSCCRVTEPTLAGGDYGALLRRHVAASAAALGGRLSKRHMMELWPGLRRD